MLRPYLIKVLEWRHRHLRTEEIERIVQVILGGLADALARGDRVELREFGAFSVKHRSSRKARNRRSGAVVEVAAKTVPAFRASKTLLNRLNDTFAKPPSGLPPHTAPARRYKA